MDVSDVEAQLPELEKQQLEKQLYPVLTNQNISNITQSSATLSITTDKAGPIYYLAYTDTTIPSIDTIKQNGNMIITKSAGIFSETVNNLNPDTTYHIWAVKTSEDGYSALIEFPIFTTSATKYQPPELEKQIEK